MASTVMNVQPENSDSSQSAALELLRPDPPLEQIKVKDDGEDELEALRMAALASIRPKKSSYKVQAHPVRSNLSVIVPVEPEETKPKPKLLPAVILNSRNSQSPGKSSKFNRHDSDKSSVESDSEEEIEVEEEVTATESEGENEEQSTTKNDAGKDTTKNSEENPAVVKKQISIEPDDVLKIDCTDEVDEFTNFLNEIDDELKSPKSEGPKVDKMIDKKAGPKPKKTKIIIVKKKVKKVRNQALKPAPGSRPRSRTRSPRSRSPQMRGRRSPRRRYSRSPPPRGGRYSPYRRSPSPYRRRRYSRSPSPRGRYRPRSRSRSPRSYRSPPRRPARRSSRSPLSPQRRGGSAPRHTIRSRSGSREPPGGVGANKKEDPKMDKSKSLPPSQIGNKKNTKLSLKEKEEKAAVEAEEKLKRLPTPEREKLLQRRKKFEGNMPVKSMAKKISLKRNIDNDNGESVGDTQEMFDNNDTTEAEMPPAKNRRQTSKGKQ